MNFVLFKVRERGVTNGGERGIGDENGESPRESETAHVYQCVCVCILIFFGCLIISPINFFNALTKRYIVV